MKYLSGKIFIIYYFINYIIGYALDPTVDSTEIIGHKPDDSDEFKTVFESVPKRPADKRKRHKNDNPEDIDGYLGPWGCYVDEQKISKPEGVRNALNNYRVFETLSIHFNVLFFSCC